MHLAGRRKDYVTVHALDVPSLPIRGKDRKDLESALQGHVLGQARLMGRYERAKP